MKSKYIVNNKLKKNEPKTYKVWASNWRKWWRGGGNGIGRGEEITVQLIKNNDTYCNIN